MTAVRSAIVIGGGIGGLTVGHALARLGVATKIVEIGSGEPIGTGITVLGNTLRALDELGLVEECLAGGKTWDRVSMRGASGELVSDQPAPRVWKEDQPAALGIMRPRLAAILEDSAVKSGAEILHNTHATAIVQDEKSVTITLSTGEEITADVLIAADGVYSPTRDMVFKDVKKPQYVGQGVWRYTIPRTPEFDGLSLYRSKDGQVGSLILSDEFCYLFSLENSVERPQFPESENIANMKRLLAPFTAPEIVAAREAMSPEHHISYRPFDVLFMEDRWHEGRVVLLGDAAHSLTPQMTSGGGMAIEDALVLAQEIEANTELEPALANYFERRMPRAKRVFDIGYALSVEEQNPQKGHAYTMGLLQEGHSFLAAPL